MSGLIIPGQPGQPPTPLPAAPAAEQMRIHAGRLNSDTIGIQIAVGTIMAVTFNLPVRVAPLLPAEMAKVIDQAMSGLLVAEAQPPQDLHRPNGGRPA